MKNCFRCVCLKKSETLRFSLFLANWFDSLIGMSASEHQGVNNKADCHNREVALHCIPAISSVTSEGQGRRSH